MHQSHDNESTNGLTMAYIAISRGLREIPLYSGVAQSSTVGYQCCAGSAECSALSRYYFAPVKSAMRVSCRRAFRRRCIGCSCVVFVILTLFVHHQLPNVSDSGCKNDFSTKGIQKIVSL